MDSSRSRLLPWLQLVRASAAPSAISNILVGFLVMNGSWTPVAPLLLLVLSSLCLYSAGMASNDIFDLESDRRDKRKRPLATGSIKLQQARQLCAFLFLAGIGCSAAVSLRSLVIALMLTCSILLYNGPLKKTLAGPLMMGVCRSLNLLLGASCIPQTLSIQMGWIGWPPDVWWISISLGILISGLTYYARNESQINERAPLMIGATIILTGLIGFATTEFSMAPQDRHIAIFPLLILFISGPFIIRLAISIQSCKPRQIQFAVISLLKSLIVYDASFCLLFGQPDLRYALAVLALLIPSLLLGKWISST